MDPDPNIGGPNKPQETPNTIYMPGLKWIHGYICWMEVCLVNQGPKASVVATGPAPLPFAIFNMVRNIWKYIDNNTRINICYIYNTYAYQNCTYIVFLYKKSQFNLIYYIFSPVSYTFKIFIIHAFNQSIIFCIGSLL